MKNWKNILIGIAMMLVIALPTFAKPTRIKFKKGATSTTISGTMSSYNSKRVYVIRVRDGQTLSVKDIGKHAVSIYIQGPPGRSNKTLLPTVTALASFRRQKATTLSLSRNAKRSMNTRAVLSSR